MTAPTSMRAQVGAPARLKRTAPRASIGGSAEAPYRAQWRSPAVKKTEGVFRPSDCAPSHAEAQ